MVNQAGINENKMAGQDRWQPSKYERPQGNITFNNNI